MPTQKVADDSEEKKKVASAIRNVYFENIF